MGISDFFRPKWRHSDAAVRAGAVEEMDDDDTEVLLRIADQDTDWTVRKLAVGKVLDPGALLGLASRCEDRRVQRLARLRATALLVEAVVDAQDDEERLAALEDLPDDASRAEVVRRIEHKAIRHAALDRIDDAEVLFPLALELTDQGLSLKAVARIDAGAQLLSIALEDPRERVAQAALERVEDPDGLTAVAGQAKNKAIRNLARRRLKEAKIADPEHREESLQKRKRQARMNLLCETAERLSESSDWVNAGAEIRKAQTQWAELIAEDQGDSPQLDARFKTACTTFLTRQHQADQRREALARQREALQADQTARESICEQINALEGADTLERLAGLERQWSDLGPSTGPDKAEAADRFAAAQHQCRLRHEAWTSQHQRTRAFERLLAEAEEAVALRDLAQARRHFDAVRDRWTNLTESQGRDLAFKRRFAKVRRSLEQRENQREKQRQPEKQRQRQRQRQPEKRRQSQRGDRRGKPPDKQRSRSKKGRQQRP